jgi:hypothetical protein
LGAAGELRARASRALSQMCRGGCAVDGPFAPDLPIDVTVVLVARHWASRLAAAGELRARASRAASQIGFRGPVADPPPILPIDFTTGRSGAGDARRGAAQINPTASR